MKVAGRLLNKKLKRMNLSVSNINPSASHPRLLSDRNEDDGNEEHYRLREYHDFRPNIPG